MRNKVLDAVLADLRRVSAKRGMGSACQPELAKGIRELKIARRSGKLDVERILRATALISEALLDEISARQVEPDSKSERRQAG